MQFTLMREARKLRQEDVAEALGIDRSAVSKWETGKALPRAEMLFKLADLYNCTIDDLLASNPATKTG